MRATPDNIERHSHTAFTRFRDSKYRVAISTGSSDFATPVTVSTGFWDEYFAVAVSTGPGDLRFHFTVFSSSRVYFTVARFLKAGGTTFEDRTSKVFNISGGPFTLSTKDVENLS